MVHCQFKMVRTTFPFIIASAIYIFFDVYYLARDSDTVYKPMKNQLGYHPERLKSVVPEVHHHEAHTFSVPQRSLVNQTLPTTNGTNDIANHPPEADTIEQYFGLPRSMAERVLHHQGLPALSVPKQAVDNYLTNVTINITTNSTNTSKAMDDRTVSKSTEETRESRSSKQQGESNHIGSGLNRSICEEIKMMPAGSMPVIALASPPGAGNTWLRYLIERVTGIYTGSIYNDKALIQGGFVGESEPPLEGRTVAVRMHRFNPIVNRTILLVRDLSECILSEFNRRTSSDSRHSHTVVANESMYKLRDELSNCVVGTTEKWLGLISAVASHTTSGGRVLVVHYQDLKTDLPNQLRRIVKFLGLPLSEERLKCTLFQKEGNYHRPPHKLSFNPFDNQMTRRISKAVTDSQKIMKEYHLPPLKLNTTISHRIFNSSYR